MSTEELKAAAKKVRDGGENFVLQGQDFADVVDELLEAIANLPSHIDTVQTVYLGQALARAINADTKPRHIDLSWVTTEPTKPEWPVWRGIAVVGGIPAAFVAAVVVIAWLVTR